MIGSAPRLLAAARPCHGRLTNSGALDKMGPGRCSKRNKAVSTSLMKGGDAYVEEMAVLCTAISCVYCYDGIHIGHKSKIAAPAKDTAIFIDTNLLG